MRSKHTLFERLNLKRLLPPGVGLVPMLLLVETCPFPTTLPSPVAQVTIAADQTSLAVGSQTQIRATVTDAAGNVLADQSVTWSSGNTSVATVLPSSPTAALVTGVGDGSTQISAVSEGKSGALAVSVTSSSTTAPVASVTVTLESASLVVGSTTNATATLRDSLGNVLSGRSVFWSSNNLSAASVVATSPTTAQVTAVGAGSAVIKAASESTIGTAGVTVTAASSCLTSAGAWQNRAMSSQTGSFEARFDATPANANMDGVVGLSSGAAADWTDLAAIVRFNEGTIDARNGGVYAAAAAIPYTAGTTYHFRLNVDIASHTYDIHVTPAGGSEQLVGRSFFFRTEQAAVSTLNNLGVYASLGSVTACNLVLSPWTPPPVASVTVSPASASVSVGQTVQLTATLKDANGNVLNGRTVTWASSALAVATVSSSGLVTGLNLGSATVTATSEGQSGTAAMTVTTSASGTTYYVSPGGNDGVSCTQAQNIGTPKRTLNNALQCLGPGTTLLIRGGTYAEALLDNIPSGTSWAEPVTLRAYPGETVVLRPTSGSWVLHFANRQSYIVIDGLVLDAAQVSPDAVKITWSGSDPSSAAHHIRLANTEVKNAPRQGILVTGSGANYNEFIGLSVHDNGSSDFDHGIYIESDGNLIEGSAFYRNAGWGIHLYDSKGTVNNNTVRNNRVYDNARVGARGPGIGVYAGAGNALYNNLVWGNKIGIHTDYGATGLRIFNNTVYGNVDQGIYNGSGNSNAAIQNNISYANGGAAIYDGGSGSTVTNNLTTSPNFVNPVAGDFHLQLGSPAIDAGVALSLVTRDFDGLPRPQGAAHDIGAFER